MLELDDPIQLEHCDWSNFFFLKLPESKDNYYIDFLKSLLYLSLLMFSFEYSIFSSTPFYCYIFECPSPRPAIF